MNRLIVFAAAALGAFALTALWIPLVRRLQVLDIPNSARKIHTRPIPLLGGVPIFVTLAISTVVLLSFGWITGGELSARAFVGILVAAGVLMIGGWLDDRFALPARVTFWPIVAAAMIIVMSGISIVHVTNPFGGVLTLAAWQSDVIVFVWLLLAMHATKLLDGVDGLTTSIGVIGALMVVLLASTAAYFQPDIAVYAAAVCGLLIGFLFWNRHPARIFLGEGGSTIVGLLIGVLAVLSGSKVATVLLVLGVPIFDFIWIVIRRFRSGGWRRVFEGDRQHLHHRLLERGWSQTRIVSFYALIAFGSGLLALVLQSRDKMFVLLVLFLCLILFAFWLSRSSPSQS